jgi:uncharacterized protein
LSQDWYADGLSFSCTQCGNCCGGAPGFVWVDDAEVAEIARTLDMPPSEFRKKHTRITEGRRSLLERPGGDCEFLVRDAGGKSLCTIHAVRPLQCRTWPFWRGNLRSAAAWERASRTCPGMNHGQHHPLPVIQAALQDNDRKGLEL